MTKKSSPRLGLRLETLEGKDAPSTSLSVILPPGSLAFNTSPPATRVSSTVGTDIQVVSTGAVDSTGNPLPSGSGTGPSTGGTQSGTAPAPLPVPPVVSPTRLV